VEVHRSGMGWRDARDEILRQHRGSSLFGLPERTSEEDRAKGFDKGQLGYDAPSNVALAVLALLEGGDDFGKVVCTAVNCGEDTDCTAATAGAVFGLMHGIDAVPAKWIEPIGRGIKTISLNLGELGHFGGQVPQTVDELTDRTERIARRVLASDGRRRMALSDSGEADLSGASADALRAGEALTRDLAARVRVARYRFDFFTVDVEAEGGPAIRNGEAKTVHLTIRNTYKVQANLLVRWHVPDGWRVEPARAGTVLSLPKLLGGTVELTFTIHAGEVTGSVAHCIAALTIDGRPTVMCVPVVLLNGNLTS